MGRPVTLVVPCFNEVERLDGEAFRRHVAEHPDVGVLFVDDGSTDGTGEALRRLAEGTDGLEVLALERNGGKAEAVRRGVSRAFEDGSRLVGFLDADLSTRLEEMEALRSHFDDPEVLLVMGARVQLLGRSIRRSRLRHYTGRVFATLASFVLRLSVYDTQCGAKLFRVTPATRAMFEEPFTVRWIFDVELIARLQAHADGRRAIREHPLEQWHDVPGSKVRMRDGLRAFLDLIRIAWRYRRPVRP